MKQSEFKYKTYEELVTQYTELQNVYKLATHELA